MIKFLISVILFRWIVIYPMDSAIQLLNNLGQPPKEMKIVAAFPPTRALFSSPLAPITQTLCNTQVVLVNEL